jgi:hypothetical protein
MELGEDEKENTDASSYCRKGFDTSILFKTSRNAASFLFA